MVRYAGGGERLVEEGCQYKKISGKNQVGGGQYLGKKPKDLG